jgi:response regulator RpfG family c-di-GMP phosphodiesterase
MTIAEKINDAAEGPFAHTHLDRDQMQELRIAAWLHDVGKITTPEYIVDKSTKLETIFDRIEILRTRFELLKRDAEIHLLKQVNGDGDKIDAETARREYLQKLDELSDEFDFIASTNIGTEFMSDEKLERLYAIAGKTWTCGNESKPLLNPDETFNLSIRRGTLTEPERKVINNHAAVTFKMLCQLPFPRRLQNVPDYAAGHHERLDGSGYPFGLEGEMLPLQSRIIALADVFEALTAKDRPYKKGKTISEAMKILIRMVEEKHLDPDLFRFFVKEAIHLDYAREELSPDQIDEIDLKEFELE